MEKTFYITLRGIDLDNIEVTLPEDADESDMLNAAIIKVEEQLNTSAKLDYYR